MYIKNLIRQINLCKIQKSLFSKKIDKLFTPGPLLTSSSVKEKMLNDFGSRDPQFIKLIQEIREGILKIGNVTSQSHSSILMQGSGSFAIEATLQTAIPRQNYELLIISNGAYGERQVKMCEYAGIKCIHKKYRDDQVVREDEVQEIIENNKGISHVSLVHSETTSGLINDVGGISRAIKKVKQDVVVIVDAMSSFGAHYIDLQNDQIDFLVSSSNKCIQGAPGFAFTICRNDLLAKCKGNSRVLTLDLYDQHQSMNLNGQFRFTPPTHVLAAFHQAMQELFQEGGVQARGKRYQNNQKILLNEMTKLGFKTYIDQNYQGYIITTFMQPHHQNWNFDKFYQFLADRNNIIYPGKLTQALSFRIGSIGELYQEDMYEIIANIKQYLTLNSITLI